MTTTVLVPLATGFEEIEAVTIIDVLRRAEVDVTSAARGGGVILGSRGIRVEADADLAALDLDAFDAIVVPGGLGGTLELMGEADLLAALRRYADSGKWVAAICAGPMVLVEAGVTDGVPITSHPGVRDRLAGSDLKDAPRVLRSGRILTSQGPGTAMEFTLALVGELVGQEAQRDLAAAMVVAEGPDPTAS
jgi:protein deglycase